MKKSILFSIVAILFMSFSCSKEENTATSNYFNFKIDKSEPVGFETASAAFNSKTGKLWIQKQDKLAQNVIFNISSDFDGKTGTYTQAATYNLVYNAWGYNLSLNTITINSFANGRIKGTAETTYLIPMPAPKGQPTPAVVEVSEISFDLPCTTI